MDELLRELEQINAMAQAKADYAKTLALLRAMKAGSVRLSDVDLIADGWTVTKPAPPEPQPAEQKIAQE